MGREFRGWLGLGFRSMMGKSYNLPFLYVTVAIAILLYKFGGLGGQVLQFSVLWGVDNSDFLLIRFLVDESFG
jgi:hypothetical protein